MAVTRKKDDGMDIIRKLSSLKKHEGYPLLSLGQNPIRFHGLQRLYLSKHKFQKAGSGGKSRGSRIAPFICKSQFSLLQVETFIAKSALWQNNRHASALFQKVQVALN